VILPNSDLITGVVKNWTHSDKLGRLSVPVGVSYDSDPQQVCEILTAVAAAHKLVLTDPPPSVLFLRFGDSSLDFELRAVVADINQRLSTISDLHFEIFRRFREAKIEIPFPQRDIHIKSAPAETREPPAKDR
jgi:small-conductance mechanosensitive channel